jgi:hypothetical protein
VDGPRPSFTSFHASSSYVLDSPNHAPPDLGPINLGVEFLVDKPHDDHVLAPDKVQAVADLRTGFFVVLGPYYALNGVAQDQVRELVAGQEISDQRPAIGGDDENLLCEDRLDKTAQRTFGREEPYY